MKKLFYILFCFTLFAQAQTIYDGAYIVIRKSDHADWTEAANQDRITENVWLTRKNNRGIFNIATENSYANFVSPSGTEWAFGTTNDLESLTFNNWQSTVSSNPPSMLNQDMVLHIISEDIYIDIKFLSWTGSNGGGGFSYERRTESLSVNDIETKSEIKITPNPSSNYIQIQNLQKPEFVSIFDVNGKIIFEELVPNNKQINIRNFAKGVYFLKIKNETLKVIKE